MYFSLHAVSFILDIVRFDLFTVTQYAIGWVVGYLNETLDGWKMRERMQVEHVVHSQNDGGIGVVPFFLVLLLLLLLLLGLHLNRYSTDSICHHFLFIYFIHFLLFSQSVVCFKLLGIASKCKIFSDLCDRCLE